MKTKLVYVLVSTDNDLYWEQALLSVFSARYHNPGAEIILITDDKTNATLQGKRAKIVEYVTVKTVIDIDAKYTNRQRSRILKTTAREHIEGDYLFIDCDTIVVADLSEIDKFTFEMAAVKDCHITLDKNVNTFRYLKKIAKATGWSDKVLDNIHFNSGVLYVKDNANTRKFYNDWYHYWMECMQKGFCIDQPAFAMANLSNDCLVSELNGVWNCQWRFGLKYFAKSKIIHYLSSNKDSISDEPMAEFMDEKLYLEIKETGDVGHHLIQMIVNPTDYLAEQTDILANKDVLVWNSETGLFVRSVYRNFPRIFKCFNFISRCLLYFDNHIFKVFKR